MLEKFDRQLEAAAIMAVGLLAGNQILRFTPVAVVFVPPMSVSLRDHFSLEASRDGTT